MLCNHRLPRALRYIHDDNIVSVDVNSLVTNNQFLELRLFILSDLWSHDKQFTVADVKLVFVFSQELKVVDWISLRHLYDEETQFFIVLVGNEVELFVVFIVEDFLNDSNIKLFIQINFQSFFNIFVDTIFLGRNDHNVLLWIHLEEFRLSV